MNKMKRVLSVLLTVVMLCAMLVVPANAAGEDVIYTVGEWTQTGKTGTITVMVSGPNGGSATVNMLQIALQFDKDVLTLTAVDQGDVDGMSVVKPNATAIANSNESGVTKLSIVDMGAVDHTVSANTVMVTYTFTVKDGVESCSADFTLDATQAKAQHGVNENCTVGVENKTAQITGEAPMLDTVTLNPTSVEVNGTTGGTVNATATSTSNKDVTGFVTWSVTAAADSGVSINAETGAITVDAKAKAGTYTVTATPKTGEAQGTAKTATLTVTRVAAEAKTVEVTGDAIIAKPTTGNTEVTYTATVTDQYGDTMTGQTIAWTNTSTLTGVTVADNKVTVAHDAAIGEFDLTATVGTASGKITVKVVDIVFEGVDAGVTVKETPVYGDTWGDIVKVDASKITAKVGAETVTGTYTVKDATVVPAAGEGTYEVTFTSTDEAYKDMPVASDKVTVAKKVVTVTANDVDVKVGTAADEIAPELGWTATELVGEDKIAGTAAYKFFELDEDGNKTATEVNTIDTEVIADYAIEVSDLTVDPAASAGNYDVKFEDGVLSVRRKNLKPPAIGTGTKPGEPTGGNQPQPVEPETKIDFVDVADEDWFAGAVDFVVTKGLFKGMSETEFAPNNAMTRAMVATVLYRLDGEHKGDVTAAFEDVADGTWYTDGVAWAAEKGVVKGLSETVFAPNDNVTREQLATMIYRYAGEPEVTDADMSDFVDAESVSDWAEAAMGWAVENDIIRGKDGARLDPQGNATRAEVATMLQRFVNLEK